MFAGPNGSGKSTVKGLLPPGLLGVYVNPDELEADIRRTGAFDPASYGVTASVDEVRDWLAGSAFLAANGLAAGAAAAVTGAGPAIGLRGLAVNSYHATVLSDFLRRELIRTGVSFSFETVMSAPDKVDLLRDARAAGFRTYLYYVATENPDINIARVAERVRAGGHDVPLDKVVARYRRSLGLLCDAVRHTDRAYLFDNSGPAHVWVAEVTGGTKLELTSAEAPEWLRTHLLDVF